eukprot:TRINITY_DN51174_c0_g1_i1.p1 TRINITY_DN51174_c0_g1~~TRINITY_DN51174_c0_g1_i1.p1  ORF type:complete len:407 (+),score=42.62 TRINITY_DN51174_c0_g1_i1:74-1294(+)
MERFASPDLAIPELEVWVAQVAKVFRGMAKATIRRDLLVTRDPNRTVNRLLDTKTTGYDPAGCSISPMVVEIVDMSTEALVSEVVAICEDEFPTTLVRHEAVDVSAGASPSEISTRSDMKCSSTSSNNLVRPGWGSLRPPTAHDFKIRRGVGSLLQPPPLDFLVVLDFEWTADNQRPMVPISEITQFPSVLVKLAGRKSTVVDEFNTYVRPTLNPVLTKFSIELTGITQDTVNCSPPIEDALRDYLNWLRRHELVSDELGTKVGRWEFCTWTDADIGMQLVRELRHKHLTMPPCFEHWIDLKILYKRHYKKEPTGGLQACVERLGLTFEGRAHDGLIDSRNTAAIVLHMAKGSMLHGSFTFRRPTRGLNHNGEPYGNRSSRDSKRLRVDVGGTLSPSHETVGAVVV